jgi:hypothetical protein
MKKTLSINYGEGEIRVMCHRIEGIEIYRSYVVVAGRLIDCGDHLSENSAICRAKTIINNKKTA